MEWTPIFHWKMKRFWKASIKFCYVSASDHRNDAVSHRGPWTMKSMRGLLVVMMGLSILFSVSTLFKYQFQWGTNDLNLKPQRATLQDYDEASSIAKNDLLSTEFDEKSCVSRYQSPLHHLPTLRKASPYLVSELRSYEARHKRCAPYTHLYNRTVTTLKSNRSLIASECKYIVSVPINGLGNKIMGIASTFLYALLTDRVLLIDRGNDIPDLFCEPFPKGSWLLPLDFPLANQLNNLNQTTQDSFWNLLKENNSSDNLTSSLQYPYVYVHLSHDYDDKDRLFFCDQEQSYLHTVPWLVLKSDLYFIPALFLIPSFNPELNLLFPDKETVFHLLGRYLFHPTNSVWGLVSRFYQAYLSNADVKVGIQLRVSQTSKGPGPLKHIMDQILSCSMTQGILPQIYKQELETNKLIMEKNKSLVAVLITTLTRSYFDEMRKLYWENPTTTGEIIAVHQPSFEEYQQTENKNHDMKAWAEMYLLSLSDKLITTSWSTFGYVAQGLGGLRPWILYTAKNETIPDPPCQRVQSMEPCFHAPPVYDCKMRQGADTEALPYVRHCEDLSWGIKLVESHSDV